MANDTYPPDAEVLDNEARKRFELEIDGQKAIMEYIRRKDDVLYITHTEVPKALEGRGIAKRLARHSLAIAQAEHRKIMPLCPFMAAYMKRHPETGPLLMDGVNL